MKHYSYLIIGGGMTADAAVRGIRKTDPTGSIGAFSLEKDPPYNRPPLTKGLWKGKPLEKIWRGTEDLGADLHLGCRINTLDPEKKHVIDDQGETYSYDKLLLATGGSPRHLPFGGDDIIYYRTLADYRLLRSLTGQGKHFLVIGGGFIGSEITAALNMNGEQVTMAFPEPAIGANIYPADVANFLNETYRKKGVEALAGDSVTGMEKHAGKMAVKFTDGQERVFDVVVAGVGIQPSLELAKQAGLETDNGIQVDEALRTSRPDIYAAGDAASFYNPTLEKRMRVEHEDNANTMGMMAGQSMAGEKVTYNYLPYFYSDLFEIGYEAVGELTSRNEVFADWQQPYEKGVLYYLNNGQVRGVLLWNVWEKVEAARALIAQPGPWIAETLKGKIQ